MEAALWTAVEGWCGSCYAGRVSTRTMTDSWRLPGRPRGPWVGWAGGQRVSHQCQFLAGRPWDRSLLALHGHHLRRWLVAPFLLMTRLLLQYLWEPVFTQNHNIVYGRSRPTLGCAITILVLRIVEIGVHEQRLVDLPVNDELEQFRVAPPRALQQTPLYPIWILSLDFGPSNPRRPATGSSGRVEIGHFFGGDW